jgi:hypothetical protein
MSFPAAKMFWRIRAGKNDTAPASNEKENLSREKGYRATLNQRNTVMAGIEEIKIRKNKTPTPGINSIVSFFSI